MDMSSRACPSQRLGTEPAQVPVALAGARQHFVQCFGRGGLHRVAYTEWGEPDNPAVLVCVHGLTRNGRDFDYLAQALCDRFRVVCPDMVGRGRSDWLEDPAGYVFETYLADMVTLIARLNVPEVCWVGTSMGGVIGMLLAGLPDNPVKRLVLNDVGPVISTQALQRIGLTVGANPLFPSLEAAERWIRETCAPFGHLSAEQWRHLTVHSVEAVEGGFRLCHDPRIAEVFHALPMDRPVDLWHAYRAVRCPTLAIRGELSDLLPPEALWKMAHTGPCAQTLQIKGVGHAPTLMTPEQIEAVRAFLLAQT